MGDPQVTIRAADVDDASRMARALILAGLREPDEQLEGRVLRSLRSSPETCFVAEREDALVGALIAVFNGFHVFLSQLAVVPAHRGSGTGAALHGALVASAGLLGAAGIITDSRLSGTGFYQRLGYRLPGAVFLIRDLARPPDPTSG